MEGGWPPILVQHLRYVADSGDLVQGGARRAAGSGPQARSCAGAPSDCKTAPHRTPWPLEQGALRLIWYDFSPDRHRVAASWAHEALLIEEPSN